MIGNVQIIKNSGESLTSNGVARFKFNDTNKQYIVYTLGEQENGLIKIYIGYENDEDNDLGITEIDSANITELIKKMATNKDFSSVATIIPLTENIYHVHDKVKGVKIPAGAINNIVSAQQKGQIQTMTKDEPIIKENTFFATTQEQENDTTEKAVQEQNIFSNPIQPIIETPKENLISEETANASVASSQETVNAGVPQGTIEEMPNYPQSPSTPSAAEGIIQSSNESEKLISDEDAKKAILAVEAAQEIIKENIPIIKEFIKQQKSKNIQNNGTLNSIASETQEQKNLEMTTISREPESLPLESNFKSVSEIQPAGQDNVLNNDSNLIVPQTETLNSENKSVVDDAIATPDATIDNAGVIKQQETTQSTIENEPVLENSSSANETQPEIIDTLAMIPQQDISNTGQASLISEKVESQAIDTTNMVSGQNTLPQTEGIDGETTILQTPAQDMASKEQAATVVDIPIIDMGGNIINGTYGNSQNTVNTDGVSEVNGTFIDNSNLNTLNSGIQPQKDEFAIPQIDMNVPVANPSQTPVANLSQAPVVLPDGQSQDSNQNLVLTPEAFNKAA